eukprot:4843945-Pyramimonas_sp.AAC.3
MLTNVDTFSRVLDFASRRIRHYDRSIAHSTKGSDTANDLVDALRNARASHYGFLAVVALSHERRASLGFASHFPALY